MSLLSATRPLEEGSGINLTPLLDMLFLLIVFFIVSSVFVEEEKDMEVQLPVSVQAEALTAPQPIVINIRQDGTLIHHGRTLTPDELERELKAAFEQQPGRSVILRRRSPDHAGGRPCDGPGQRCGFREIHAEVPGVVGCARPSAGRCSSASR
jgi:biopolymer transport protein ExbD